jgi:hypothetical protein
VREAISTKETYYCRDLNSMLEASNDLKVQALPRDKAKQADDAAPAAVSSARTYR